MKIFDTSQLIAIFNQFQYPKAFDVILQLGHELSIPYYVWKELKDKNSRANADRLIGEGKLARLNLNTFEEIEDFGKTYRKLKHGEIDVILTYMKLSVYKQTSQK